NVTRVTHVYETRNVTNVTYVSQRVPGAVIAVPTTTFTQAKPVAREVVRVQPQNITPQAVMVAAPVAPAKQSVLGAQPAAHKPPENVFTKQVVAQTAPPPPPASMESKLSQLQSHPGRPIEPSAAPARPAAPATAAPAVKVMPPA